MLWTANQLTTELQKNCLEVFRTKDLSNGIQLILRGGTIINIYCTGLTNVQGKNANPAEKELASIICNGQDESPLVYLFTGSNKKSNDEIKIKLTSAGIDFKSSNSNPLSL